jgi:hypothetical protein
MTFHLIKDIGNCGDIHKVKMCWGAPLPIHLLFVGDCFLFCQVGERKTQIIYDALKTYKEASNWLLI